MRYGIYDKKDDLQLKKLWKTAFHDADTYIEYYFRHVTSRNLIFAAWDEDKLISMVHLNPYTLVCQGRDMICHYIVGVATDPAYQKQGIMTKLLSTALLTLQERGEYFTYLMPAREEYYHSLGFQKVEPGYIFSWQDYLSLNSQNENYDHSLTMKWKILDLSFIKDSQWEDFNTRLSDKYALFAKRDKTYMEDLRLQCQSLSGDIYVVTDQKTIIATMGIMFDGNRPECVQYITTDNSLRPMRFVAEQLGNLCFTDIEIFGSWFEQRFPSLNKRPGKGIMYKILDKRFSNVISCDKMLMINEII